MEECVVEDSAQSAGHVRGARRGRAADDLRASAPQRPGCRGGLPDRGRLRARRLANPLRRPGRHRPARHAPGPLRSVRRCHRPVGTSGARRRRGDRYAHPRLQPRRINRRAYRGGIRARPQHPGRTRGQSPAARHRRRAGHRRPAQPASARRATAGRAVPRRRRDRRLDGRHSGRAHLHPRAPRGQGRGAGAPAPPRRPAGPARRRQGGRLRRRFRRPGSRDQLHRRPLAAAGVPQCPRLPWPPGCLCRRRPAHPAGTRARRPAGQHPPADHHRHRRRHHARIVTTVDDILAS